MTSNLEPKFCEAMIALDVIVGKWKTLILHQLILKGTQRFSDFQKLIPDINKRMLSIKLHELEEQELVKRAIYAEVPPRVEYSITEYGRTLEPILQDMHDWGESHLAFLIQNNVSSYLADPYAEGCGALTAIDTIVGKWKPVILHYLLKQGTKRFGELQNLIPNISKRMLTLHLRELEDVGVIGRTVYEVVPPKVEYFITDYGRTLEPILEKMHTWGEKHQTHIIQENHLED